MAADDSHYAVCPGCGSSIDLRRSDVVFAIAQVEQSTPGGEYVEGSEAYFHSHCFRDHRGSWRPARRPEGI